MSSPDARVRSGNMTSGPRYCVRVTKDPAGGLSLLLVVRTEHRFRLAPGRGEKVMPGLAGRSQDTRDRKKVTGDGLTRQRQRFPP